jgi:hypothetical protein
MVSWAARAVGIQVILPAASSSASLLGRDRLDLGHDQVGLLAFDQRGQGVAVGHVDHVGAVRDLVARRVRRSGRPRSLRCRGAAGK